MVSTEINSLAAAKYAGFQSKEDFGEYRAAYDAMLPGLASGVSSSTAELGGVEGEWVVPSTPNDGVILYLHGGGFGVGTAKGYSGLASRLVNDSGSRAFVVNYALVPESLFPIAIDQVRSVYDALVTKEGVSPSNIVLAADSAGGSLAVALLVGLRDEGQELPAGLLAMSPMVDGTASGDSLDLMASADPLINKEGVAGALEMYRGETPADDPRISPVFADLHGLPPMLIQVGTSEALFSDSVRLAENARNAGVKAEIRVYYEMVHVFQMFCDDIPQGAAALAEGAVFIAGVLGTT